MKSIMARIEEEMAERMAEVEDLRARMAREAADYKLLVRQYEEQLLKEGSINTGKTIDEVNYHYIVHKQLYFAFNFVIIFLGVY